MIFANEMASSVSEVICRAEYEPSKTFFSRKGGLKTRQKFVLRKTMRKELAQWLNYWRSYEYFTYAAEEASIEDRLGTEHLRLNIKVELVELTAELSSENEN